MQWGSGCVSHVRHVIGQRGMKKSGGWTHVVPVRLRLWHCGYKHSEGLCQFGNFRDSPSHYDLKKPKKEVKCQIWVFYSFLFKSSLFFKSEINFQSIGGCNISKTLYGRTSFSSVYTHTHTHTHTQGGCDVR